MSLDLEQTIQQLYLQMSQMLQPKSVMWRDKHETVDSFLSVIPDDHNLVDENNVTALATTMSEVWWEVDSYSAGMEELRNRAVTTDIPVNGAAGDLIHHIRMELRMHTLSTEHQEQW